MRARYFFEGAGVQKYSKIDCGDEYNYSLGEYTKKH